MTKFSRTATVAVLLGVGGFVAGCATSTDTDVAETSVAVTRNVMLDAVGISFDGPQWTAQNYPNGIKPTTGIVYLESGPFVNGHESRLSVVVTPGVLGSAGALGRDRVTQTSGEVTATAETETTRRADYSLVGAPGEPQDLYGATVWFAYDDDHLAWVEVLTGNATTTDAVMTEIEATLTKP